MYTPSQSTGLNGLQTLIKKQQEMWEWQQEQIDRLTKKSDKRDSKIIKLSTRKTKIKTSILP